MEHGTTRFCFVDSSSSSSSTGLRGVVDITGLRVTQVVDLGQVPVLEIRCNLYQSGDVDQVCVFVRCIVSQSRV